MSRFFRGFNVFIIISLLCAVPAPSLAAFNLDVAISVNFGPPDLPYYVQPPCPQPNFVWMPGYWAWGPAGYYWVPGTWVAAAAPGLLWTPGYWSYAGDVFAWSPGYWAPQVGFYGGIDYGNGYYGDGYAGGRWSGNQFAYNTAVTNVNTTYVRDVYVNRTVVNNYYGTPTAARVAYNGGRGGVQAQPTAFQRAVLGGHRVPLTAMQQQHIQAAANNRSFLASVNQGRPQIAAINRPFARNASVASYAPVARQARQGIARSTFARQTTNVRSPRAVATRRYAVTPQGVRTGVRGSATQTHRAQTFAQSARQPQRSYAQRSPRQTAYRQRAPQHSAYREAAYRPRVYQQAAYRPHAYQQATYRQQAYRQPAYQSRSIQARYQPRAYRQPQSGAQPQRFQAQPRQAVQRQPAQGGGSARFFR